MNVADFDAVRPYSDEEIRASIPRIVADPKFNAMMDYLFDQERKHSILRELKEVKNLNDFQRVLTVPAVETIMNSTSDGFYTSGFENISKSGHYVFIANHRDIMLDSSILGLAQLKNGFKVNQTIWGNNLMINQLIIDLGKSNQMITVFREGSPKELLLNSQRLSAYMRYSLTQLNNSIWIAQRKGRTKDGSDKTDVTILKMLSLSCEGDFIKSMEELNITPITISYEWEPCDAMKVREIYLSQNVAYVKNIDEDFQSILGGALSQKGRIHLSIGTNINPDIELLNQDQLTHNEALGEMAKIIDNQIHQNYYLWPSNYLAYDLLNNSTNYTDQYTDETIKLLEKRYVHTTEIVGQNNEEIRTLFLKLYANPVINKLLVATSS
ncbi:MAG: hypothetical protein CVT99_10095 [Bacteroidetes bacterium HGW-Bacteroidetes-16]|jgi:hypothetical protein|nr:MAG: hypothetical protein CVT99_10095 [Bacteroidetes bacterium HGW-Bacteroidetes-16]